MFIDVIRAKIKRKMLRLYAKLQCFTLEDLYVIMRNALYYFMPDCNFWRAAGVCRTARKNLSNIFLFFILTHRFNLLRLTSDQLDEQRPIRRYFTDP